MHIDLVIKKIYEYIWSVCYDLICKKILEIILIFVMFCLFGVM